MNRTVPSRIGMFLHLPVLAALLLGGVSAPSAAAQLSRMDESWASEVEVNELTAPASVLVDHDGTIWVADPRGGLFRWTWDGRRLGMHGGLGDGPGEYRAPGLLALHETGDVLLFDPGAARIVQYGADGSHHTTSSLPAPLPVLLRREVLQFAVIDGQLLVWAISLPRNEPREFEGTANLLLIEEPRSEPRELRRFDAPDHLLRRDRLNTLALPVPHGSAPLLVIHPSGSYAVADAQEDSLAFFDRDGSRRAAISLGIPSRALTPTQRSEALDRVRWRLFDELESQRAIFPPEITEYFVTKFEDALADLAEMLPEEGARIRRILADRGGGVWVQEGQRPGDAAHRWTLVGPGGGEIDCRSEIVHRGEVTAGYGAGRSLILVEMAEGDLPRLVRYDVPVGSC